MALFGSKKSDSSDNKSFDQKSVLGAESREFSVLKRPRVTEKATRLAEEENVYTFEVAKDATKKEIEAAVESLYEVKPVHVRTVKIPKKKIRQRRGKGGVKKGGKKAYVKLAEGDTIELL